MSDNGHAGDAPDWMQEQAAEYADLVGSFVESVVDSDTDEVLEYQLIWEGGDLGVALTTIEGGEGGVAVSRVTGKGFPFGIKNVGPGDLLLSINTKDTTKVNLDDVVAYLQICDLPATLRFKKLSPVETNAPVSVPRKSTYVITSGSAPDSTGPVDLTASHSHARGSDKYAPPPVPHETSSSSSFSPDQQQQSTGGLSSEKMSVSQLESNPTATRESGAIDDELAYDENEQRPYSGWKLDSAMPGVKSHEPFPPRQEASFEEELCEVDGLVLTSGENDLGCDESEDESVRASGESHDSYRDGSFDVDASHGAWDVDGEEKEDTLLAAQKGKQTNEPALQRDKSDSTAAMLGHFSVETRGDAVPILPDAEEASGIAAVDNVSDFSSAGRHAPPPRASGRVDSSDSLSSSMASSMNSSMNSSRSNTEAPRPSVRVTMDSTAPLMKSHPIGTLHEMCAKGDLRGVVQHLRVEGPEALLNREPNHGQTGLHLAVKSGKVPLVKVILEQYKPLEDIVNVEDDKGNTALHFAATKTPAMVHLLLESGASANVKNSRKFTPLIISVITSKDDSIIIPRMLLKFGANPNDMHDSHTVIHTAISTGRLHIAGALVRAGAKMDVEDAEGKSVFEKLPRKDVRYLISHIYFPPTHITKKERSECMLCHQKFKFSHREHNCTHCGRLCCAECSALQVEMYRFPMGFPGRTRRGAANREQKRVCKTCYNVFKERNEEPEKSEMSRFINRVINIEWDEVNPEKLQKEQEAGRRG